MLKVYEVLRRRAKLTRQQASFSGNKKPGNFSAEKDMTDVENFKCHK